MRRVECLNQLDYLVVGVSFVFSYESLAKSRENSRNSFGVF